MNLKILFEDANLFVVDKPASLDIEALKALLPAGTTPAHRLDKDTSGLLLVAKNPETLDFLQKQFQERKVEKKYVCLVEGNISQNEGTIETLVGRSKGDKRKQRVYLAGEPEAGKREAKTEYRVLERFKDYTLLDYTLLEVSPKTGRKHQVRAHMTYLGHPVVGDKLYGFKNQRVPTGLKRQFLHATYLKISMPDGNTKEFVSALPQDLILCLQQLKNS